MFERLSTTVSGCVVTFAFGSEGQSLIAGSSRIYHRVCAALRLSFGAALASRGSFCWQLDSARLWRRWDCDARSCREFRVVLAFGSLQKLRGGVIIAGSRNSVIGLGLGLDLFGL